MEELSVCRAFSSFQSLQDAVEIAMGGSVTVLSCKSVEQANRDVVAGERKFPEILKYKSVRLGCKQFGRAESRSASTRQSPPKLQCPAHVIAVADRDMAALCVKQVSLVHNHPVAPIASTSAAMQTRQLLPELLDDGHQISDVGLTVTVSYKENNCTEPAVVASMEQAVGHEEFVQSSGKLSAASDDFDNEEEDDDDEEEEEEEEEENAEDDDEDEEEAETQETNSGGESSSKAKKPRLSTSPESLSKKRKFSTKRYARYSAEDLQRAYDAIKKKGLSVYTVARMCGIPKSTLYDRINDRSPFGLGGRPNAFKTKILDEETERQMVEHMKHMEMIGQGLSQADILALATKLAHSLGTIASDRVISRSWYKAFLQRWPMLKKSPATSEKTKEDNCMFRRPRSVYEYHTVLKSVLDRSRVHNKPHYLYKLEELVFTMSQSEPSVERRVNVTNHKDILCSILFCGNALGYSLPPFLITRKSRKNLPDPGTCMEGSSFRQSDSGNLTLSLLKEFLRDHFLPHVVGRKEEHVVLLYADSANLVSNSLLEWAGSQNIVLFRLPPQQAASSSSSISSSTPSLDFGCFAQFAECFHTACSVHLHKNKKVQLKDLPSLVYHSMLGSGTVGNLKKAFREAGIYPWDTRKVDSSNSGPSGLNESGGEKVEVTSAHRRTKRRKTK